jgi:type VI secretion system protein ImpH
MASEVGMEAAGMSALATIELLSPVAAEERGPPPGSVVAATPSIDDALDFDLVALVLLLERLHPERARVGDGVAPAREVLRFHVPASMHFPPGQVRNVSRADLREPYDVTVHLPGLIGPMATLPWHYAEEVRDRSAAGDDVLRDFLDLLHHRTLSLFVRAAARPLPDGTTGDLLGRTLSALMGRDGADALEQGPIPGASLLSYAGLLVPHQRSAVGLEQCLADYFDVPVRVRQFSGGHYPLATSERTTLDADVDDDAVALGGGTLVGDVVFDPQARVTIEVGPVALDAYERFLPGGDAAASLAQLVRHYCDDAVEAEVHLTLAAASVPGVVLGDDDGARLGWTSWVQTRARPADAVDVTVPLGTLAGAVTHDW